YSATAKDSESGVDPATFLLAGNRTKVTVGADTYDPPTGLYSKAISVDDSFAESIPADPRGNTVTLTVADRAGNTATASLHFGPYQVSVTAGPPAEVAVAAAPRGPGIAVQSLGQPLDPEVGGTIYPLVGQPVNTTILLEPDSCPCLVSWEATPRFGANPVATHSWFEGLGKEITTISWFGRDGHGLYVPTGEYKFKGISYGLFDLLEFKPPRVGRHLSYAIWELNTNVNYRWRDSDSDADVAKQAHCVWGSDGNRHHWYDLFPDIPAKKPPAQSWKRPAHESYVGDLLPLIRKMPDINHWKDLGKTNSGLCVGYDRLALSRSSLPVSVVLRMFRQVDPSGEYTDETLSDTWVTQGPIPNWGRPCGPLVGGD
ncbi:MAG: hypothetical protein KGR26_03465, partial [Cyanobacteria bacterium REEB65]|nr:hypothetical protein [Cyanobacteria bacterium REEB65]